jgi:hypothetical protein
MDLRLGALPFCLCLASCGIGTQTRDRKALMAGELALM